MGAALGFGPRDVAVERETFFGKMGKALCGVCVGSVMFFVSVVLLGWNEFNYVRNQNVILYVEENAESASCTPSDMNVGKGVWVSCPVTKLYDFYQDPLESFSFSTPLRLNALRLFFSDSNAALNSTWIQSSAEIYQWTEAKRQVGERKTISGTTVKEYEYSYSKQWVSSPIDSSDFYCISGDRSGCVDYHGPSIQNTGDIFPPFQHRWEAPDFSVTMGSSYGMNADLLRAFANPQPVQIDALFPGLKPKGYPNAYMVEGNQLRSFLDRNQDSVGDIRAWFTSASVNVGDVVSVVAQQNGGENFVPWDTGLSGSMGTVNWASSGSASLSEMIDAKNSENDTMVIILRFVGWFLMFAGLQLVTGPISLAPEIIPCVGRIIGDIVGCALCCMNLSLATMLSLIIIAIAWVLARPLVGILLLVAAAVCGVVAYQVLMRWKANNSQGSKVDADVSPLSAAEEGARVADAPEAKELTLPEASNAAAADSEAPVQEEGKAEAKVVEANADSTV
eukprot:TRINITY_DN3143_c0_g1_i1.p1 TRINITY_DN3143_c0_g1~~TRINITY_DN3143_c0_g1_i1.p1  ORF type:complete len:507 (-),score=71.30 TRINITY_DN3143_c0_g1_i1:439-1959(-)